MVYSIIYKGKVMRDKYFFDKAKEASKVKTRIVVKYFWAWAKIIIPHAKKRNTNIGYVDFFAGPGIYADGSKSTPILILEKAIENEDIRDMLTCIFNDIDSKHAHRLKDAIDSIKDIDKLGILPRILNMDVDEEVAQILGSINTIPTLFFVDPWGYKGLSLELISSALRNWGCDCIFFFNYNRISMSINNPSVKKHIDALFGKKRATELGNLLLNDMDSFEKELSVIETISQALKEKGGKYVLPFRFKFDSIKRLSHHLIFVSKNVRGYQIMKDIMAKESTDSVQSVPSFEYDPMDHQPQQLPLFGAPSPLDVLAEILLRDFAGKIMTMQQIYDQHTIDTPYIKKNYKKALIKLENDGKILTDPSANKRQENTFGDNVQVTFPTRDE